MVSMEQLKQMLDALNTPKVQFYSIDEVARRYNVHANTVRNWTAKGWLDCALKVGDGTLRYAESDLLDFEKRFIAKKKGGRK